MAKKFTVTLAWWVILVCWVALIVTLLTRIALAPERIRIKEPLLEAICGTESDGHGVPSWSVNRYGTAWGQCQVKYWSAVHFCGFDEWARKTGTASRSPADLFDDHVNITCARDIIATCRAVHVGASNRLLAYCYYAGPHSDPYSTAAGRAYSKTVALRAAMNSRGVAFKPTE